MEEQMDNLAKLFQHSAETYADRPLFATKGPDKKYHTKSYQEVYEMARDLAIGLIAEGVKAHEHVGLFADNRLEWGLADMAIILCAAADVPRGTDVSDFDIEYIVNHSGMSILFVENEKLLKKVQKLKKKLPGLKKLILMTHGDKLPAGVLGLYDLIAKGQKLRPKKEKELEKRIKGIKASDLFTLIYTSGTTGTPKGVMLTHDNAISQINNIEVRLYPQDRLLSILPVWHIFERVIDLIVIYSGATLYYSSIRELLDNLKLAKPTMMGSAPRLWETVYNKINKKLDDGPPVKKTLFNIAVFFSSNCGRALRFLKGKELQVKPPSPLVQALRVPLEVAVLVLFSIPNKIFDLLVFSKIRATLGGAFRGTISGGGALPPHVDNFFNNIGIPVLEGYGLTETSPVIAVRKFEELVVGTVGPLVPGTELKIVDIETKEQIFPGKFGVQGEVWVRGSLVMRGYYKDRKKTKEVLNEDGWFNTGDLGMMTYNRCLKLVGRSKDTIVLMNGENIQPTPIENMLSQSHYIDNCMVVGQDEKFLGALIVPAAGELSEYGKELKELAKNPDVENLIKSEIKRLVSSEHGFKAFEKVIVFHLLDKPFEIGDELTPKQSIKRHVVTEKYKKVIKAMYK